MVKVRGEMFWRLYEQIIRDQNSERMNKIDAWRKKLLQKKFSLSFGVLSGISNVANLTR